MADNRPPDDACAVLGTDIVRFISSLRFYIGDITQIKMCGHRRGSG